MHTTRTSFDRRALAARANQAAIATRAKAQLDQHSPVCIYGLSDALGIVVRFNNINMEGMYQRGTPPRIHLSAHRPLPRRAFNCAHELAHHVFGHGSSIDQLREEAKENPWEDPKEFLADAFAGFTLMPVIGLHRAFQVRDWNPGTTTASQMFTIACEFGVGYETLITHLSIGVKIISRGRAATLKKQTPKSLRKEILGAPTANPLLVVDRHQAGSTLDTEVDTLLLLPSGTEVTGSSLAHERDFADGRLFRAVRAGIVQASTEDGAWAKFVRVAPKGYIGLAKYRHLEEEPDE